MSETANEVQWEVYSTLDVKLGEYFNTRPELQDSFLFVDERAVLTALQELGPGEAGHHKLIFELAHPASFLKGNLSRIANSGMIGSLERKDERGKHRDLLTNRRPVEVLHCKIGILEREIEAVQMAATAAKKILEPGSYITPLSFAVPSIAAHELQHAVDSTDEQILRKELTYRARILGAVALTGSVGFSVTYNFLPRAVEALNRSTLHAPELVSKAAAAAFGLGIFAVAAQRANRYLNRKIDVQSPMERSAYAIHDTQRVRDLPPMVYLGFNVVAS